MSRIRTGIGLVACILLVSAGAWGQAPKSEGKAKGQLPPNWGKLKMSDEQRQQVYKIQGEYRAKIDALEAKVKDLRKQQDAALAKVLTDAQKAQLREIITSKVPGAGDKIPEKAEKPPIDKKP